MQLHSSTIKKLLRQHVHGEPPFQVTAAQRETLVETLTQRLAGFQGVTVDRRSYYASEQERARHVCSLALRDSEPYLSYWGNTFQLRLNEQGILTLVYARQEPVVVASLDEVVAFMAACQEAMERQQALASKRQKVRDLKAQAVIAQVKKLAREEQFDFYTKTDVKKLTLYVKLTDKDSLELQIAFKQFAAVLPNLRATILGLRELYRHGITFKLSSSHYHKYRWISHTSL